MHPLLCTLVFTTSFSGADGALATSSVVDAPPSSLAVTADEVQGDAKKVEAPKQDPAKDGLDMRVFWKDGFRMETADKSFTMRISGRFQNDWAWFSADESKFDPVTGSMNDGTEIRRAYLGFDGKIFSDWEWKLEWDLSKPGNDFADAYLGTSLGFANLRVGHFKQPQGLEELTNDLYTTFMERSLQGAFKTGRDTGVMISNTMLQENGSWAFGIFRDANPNGSSSTPTSDDEYCFTGRGTWAPINEDGGNKLVHVGASLSWRNPTGNTVAFTSKPESNLAPNFLDTGASITNGDDYFQYGLEAAGVLGPLSLQGELMQANVDGNSAGNDDPTLTGYYLYASYFITGEHRPYKRSNGTFDRVTPNSNYSTKGGGGRGAWEVGLRYTDIDFSEAVAGTQEMQDVTAGVNWYINPYVKVQLNVIRSHLERATLDDDAIITELRFQFDV